MIQFSLAVRNPVWRESHNDLFKNYYSRDWPISQHKSLVFDITWHWYNLLELRVDTMWWGRDHAGIYLEIGVLGFNISVNLYDHRHWDESTNTWVGDQK